MAYFKIEQPNQPTKWIKSIDRANGTLEFTTEKTNDCFQQDSGFFADSEFAYLKFHFTEAYPELEFMTIDDDYHRWRDVNEPIAEEPDIPWGGEVNGVGAVAQQFVNAPAAPIPQYLDEG